MNNNKKGNCVRCMGNGSYESTHGRMQCPDCDGTKSVSKEKRKAQLKARRDLFKKMELENKSQQLNNQK